MVRNSFCVVGEKTGLKGSVRGGSKEDAGWRIHVRHGTRETVGSEARFRWRLGRLVGHDRGRGIEARRIGD